jgi:hypothetical protein
MVGFLNSPFDKYLVINKSPLGDLGANIKTGLFQHSQKKGGQIIPEKD